MADLKTLDIIVEKLKRQIKIIESGEDSNLSEKNEIRLRRFIGEIKKIAPMNLYLIFDDSSSWYSDIDRDNELSLTLHANCQPDGSINFKAEVVTTLEHARQILTELLGKAAVTHDDCILWVL